MPKTKKATIIEDSPLTKAETDSALQWLRAKATDLESSDRLMAHNTLLLIGDLHKDIGILVSAA